MRPGFGKTLPLALAVAYASCAFAEAPAFNPDDLPVIEIPLPDGKTVRTKRYLGRNWRVVDVAALAGENEQDPDVCFEGKFEALVAPDKLKLAGFAIAPGGKDIKWAIIIVDDRLKKLAASFKLNDNLWFCGRLRKTAPRPLEFVAFDIQKLESQKKRWEKQIDKLRQQGDAASLVNLGGTIRTHARDFVGTSGFEDFEELENLANRAIREGLTLTESALTHEDYDGQFAVAVQWRDLLHDGSRYHRIVDEILKKNPEHPKAAIVARDEFHYVLVDGAWHTEEEAKEIEKRRQKEHTEDVERDKQRQAEVERARQTAIQNRASLLAVRESELRTADPKAREQALLALGEAARSSLDMGFAAEAMDILVNSPGPAAVQGLGIAIKSVEPAVRSQAFEALAWRGRQDPAALDGFGAALAAESDRDAAFSAVAAAETLDARPAAELLVKGLDNPNGKVQEVIMAGLGRITKQPSHNKQEWRMWWQQNKDNLK